MDLVKFDNEKSMVTELLELATGEIVITNGQSEKAVRAIKRKFVTLRTDINNTAKEIKRSVDGERNKLLVQMENEELRYAAAIKVWEEKKATEKAERDRIEAERVSAIRRKVDEIRTFGVGLEFANLEMLKARAGDAFLVDIDDSFEEFKNEAKLIMEGVVNSINRAIADKEAFERERVAREAAEAELAELRADKEKRDREAAEAQLAANKKETQAIANGEAAKAAVAKRESIIAETHSISEEELEEIGLEEAESDEEKENPGEVVETFITEDPNPKTDDEEKLAVDAYLESLTIPKAHIKNVRAAFIAGVDWAIK